MRLDWDWIKAMINDLEIALRAENPLTNCWRDYTLLLGRDLLGDWCLSVHWGRIGAAGSMVMHGFGSRNEAVAFASALLKRRLSAPRRIGCPYRLIASSGAERFGLAGVIGEFPLSTA
jgi:predicted DNA-binding WGR domain protein